MPDHDIKNQLLEKKLCHLPPKVPPPMENQKGSGQSLKTIPLSEALASWEEIVSFISKVASPFHGKSGVPQPKSENHLLSEALIVSGVAPLY